MNGIPFALRDTPATAVHTRSRFGARVQTAAGELGEPGAFAGVDASELTHIVQFDFASP